MPLEISNITVGYVKEINILHNVSLKVERGEITALIGPNGVGKSTLFKTIYGFLTPSEGDITLENKSIVKIPPHEIAKRGIGYIPQESGLFRYLSVLDNLRLAAHFVGNKTGGELLTPIFRRFPILFQRKRMAAGNLSGGQQKQLEIAKRTIIVELRDLGFSDKEVKGFQKNLKCPKCGYQFFKHLHSKKWLTHLAQCKSKKRKTKNRIKTEFRTCY